MGWNYDPEALGSNELFALRLEIGDTDPRAQQLQDEEILYLATLERNYWAAAARCCEAISRVILRKADVKLGRAMMVTYTKMANQYMLQAQALRKKAMGTVVPFVGGMNVSDKLAYNSNSSLVAPAFTRTMQENPWTGGYTSDSLGPVPSNADDSGTEF